MGLIDLKTNLKSIKYGHDRPGGGNSGQPYIQTNINRPGANLIGNFDDGLVRGGIAGAAKASVVDTIRIGKFLTDFPKGPLFIVKQVGLQLSNPKLESKAVSTGIGFIDRIATSIGKIGIGPTRTYNLGINTIAQVPVNAFGIHFNRHGLLPVQDDNTKYLAVAQENNKNYGANNRLVGYAKRLLPQTQPQPTKALSVAQSLLSLIPGASNFITPQQQMIDQYIGGPGSVYGIGKTFIRRYDYTQNGVNKQQPQEKGKINYAGLLGLSSKYFDSSLINEKVKTNNPLTQRLLRGGIIAGVTDINTLPALSLQPQIADYDNIDLNNPTVVPSQINQNVVSYNTRTYQELKAQINKQQSDYSILYGNAKPSTDKSGSVKFVGEQLPTSTSMPEYKNGFGESFKINMSWNKATREVRVGSGRTDLINLTPIFSDNGGSINDTVSKLKIPGNPDKNINDLVKFRIQAINGNDPGISNWMIFRAYLTQFSDSVDASWNEIKYAGRGDKFYVYDGFSRKINIGFKVAVLSAGEMEPIYQKLNYLMGNLMPDYNEDSLMRGPLVKMTVGNWIDGQPGIINNLSYTVPQDSPWEIGLGDEMLILPHIVEVNMTFTPIGSQTRDVNKISSKSQNTSHIAQNYNGKSELNYIKP